MAVVVQVTVQKLGSRVKPFADQMMLHFLQVFSFKSATLHEEALMAVGALANGTSSHFIGIGRFRFSFGALLGATVTGRCGGDGAACEVDFEKYMAHLRPHLIFGLSNWEEHTVCMTAVGVVGDVCRAIGTQAHRLLLAHLLLAVAATAANSFLSTYPFVLSVCMCV
jgi:importin subunit beta-1